MLNIILNIIGITLVLYSIFIIRRDISMKIDDKEKRYSRGYLEEDTFEKDLYLYKKEVLEDFDLIMDGKIKSPNIVDQEIENEVKTKNIDKKSIAIIQEKEISSQDDSISPLHKKIIELESIGLNNEEIAKKMGRGVREIDIVLKIYKNKL